MEITPFDRPGLHNHCLIDIKFGGESAQLPESVLNNIQELIDEAYDLAMYFPEVFEYFEQHPEERHELAKKIVQKDQ